MSASIASADIDYAKVKDIVTDTAIITQGLGGKLYIDRLAVTEANMVSLTVGELLVAGPDGARKFAEGARKLRVARYAVDLFAPGEYLDTS